MRPGPAPGPRRTNLNPRPRRGGRGMVSSAVLRSISPNIPLEHPPQASRPRAGTPSDQPKPEAPARGPGHGVFNGPAQHQPR
jgi:hypothetical protein